MATTVRTPAKGPLPIGACRENLRHPARLKNHVPDRADTRSTASTARPTSQRTIETGARPTTQILANSSIM